MKPVLFTEADARRLLPPRPCDSHKGKNGRLLLCVGSTAYTGAALLASAAALRVGAGLTTAAVPAAIKPAFFALPEVCCTPVGSSGAWDATALAGAVPLLAGKNALAMGCGMGENADATLLAAALSSRLPLVIDADGLNLLSRHPGMLENSLHENVILTPHPAEMARLTGLPTADILAAPAEIAARYAARWGCVLLLKGAESHIALGERLVLNTSGNSGLAKGGSGDVLTGLIAGLLAQGLAPFDAACLGAYLLGLSADRALELLGSRMLLARDVINAVQDTISSF